MMNVRQKISGIFRNCDALENFCRIRGYVSTARINSLPALRRIFLGNPFLSRNSLLPLNLPPTYSKHRRRPLAPN